MSENSKKLSLEIPIEEDYERPKLTRQTASVWPVSDCILGGQVDIPFAPPAPRARRTVTTSFTNFNLPLTSLNYEEVKEWINEKANKKELLLLMFEITQKLSNSDNVISFTEEEQESFKNIIDSLNKILLQSTSNKTENITLP